MRKIFSGFTVFSPANGERYWLLAIGQLFKLNSAVQWNRRLTKLRINLTTALLGRLASDFEVQKRQ